MDCSIKERVCGPESALYGMGFIGALIYFVTTAPNAVEIMIGFFKAVFWPAFLVFAALSFMGA